MNINTIGGQEIDLNNPRPSDIDLNDILHALSHINRYNGHTIQPYSVAQHTLAMVMFMEAKKSRFAATQAALIHDFPEYLLGDITTPLKRLLGPEYDALTMRLENAICKRFDVLDGGRHFRAIYDQSVESVDKMAARSEMKLLETTHDTQDTDGVMDRVVGAVMYLDPTGVRNLLRKKAKGYLNV